MKLKKLELFGFKSFADKEEFVFEPGITVVVGPNGCGKSNVMDGIKWVLGEQSAKSLRGKEMSDIIFGGSASRPAVGYAEASLLMSNEEGLLPIEYKEVSISRRLYASGESEYLINKNLCRLKDIRELFMGTGIGVNSYSIIEQGKVEALLQANAQQRREVFEEAAGISKYKSRKRETLLKLEKVQQNLLRLNDIVNEVEKQLRSTKIQAGKARRFKEFSERYRELKIKLSFKNFCELKERRGSLSEEINDLVKNSENVLSVLSTKEEQIQELEEKLTLLDHMLSDVNSEIIGIDAQITNFNDKIRFNNDKSADLNNQESKYNEELEELNRKISENDATLAKVKIELENMEVESKNESEQLNMKEVELEQIKLEFDMCSDSVEEKKSRIMNTFHEQSRIQNEIGNQSTLKDTLKSRKTRIENQQDEIINDLNSITQTKQGLDNKHDELTNGIAVQDDKRTIAKETISTLNSEIDSRSNDIRELEKVRSSKQARLEVLEDYETRAEGVDAGAKAVLKESSSNSDSVPEVFGLVADLIKVDLDLARAIETALGDLVQSVVTRSHDDTIKAIDFLRDTDAGHATFLPLDKVKLFKSDLNEKDESVHKAIGEELLMTETVEHSCTYDSGVDSRFNDHTENRETISDAERSNGIIGKASRLVEYSEEFKSIVNYMLDKTLIVENFNKASLLIGSIYKNNGYCAWLDKEYGKINRIITLDGSVIEKFGIIRGGIIREKPGLISRRSEMDSIKNEIVEIDQKIVILLEERTFRVEKLNIAENDLAQATEELEKLNILLINNKNEQKQEENRVIKLNDERNVIVSELKEIELNIENIEKRDLELNGQLNTLNDERTQLENEIESISDELEAKEGIRFSVQEDITNFKITIAQKNEKQDAAYQLLNRTESNVREFRGRLSSVNNGIKECADRKEIAINDKGEWEQSLKDLSLKKSESHELLNSQTGEREFLVDQLSEIKNELGENRDKHKGVEDHLHKLQLQENECRVKAADLEERIVEEHRVSLTELEKILFGVPDDENLDEGIVEQDSVEEEEEEVDKPEEVMESGSEVADSMEEENVDDEDSEQAPEEEKSNYIHELAATFNDEEMDWDNVSAEIEELRSKLSKIGNVNLDAIQEQDELEARSDFLTTQLTDLNTSENSLREIIEKLNETSRELFEKTFNDIKENFHIYFRKLFGGGRASISLESDVDILDANIEIIIQPPNKEFKAIALFSGGEKVLITVALLFAIFKSKPSPFCLMDEVDAALDESNVGRFTMVLKEFAVDSQFIIISHNKKTMSVADAIYGVTMEEPGVSKKIAVKFDKFD